MANKVLDLLLQLTVKGTDQADSLRRSIESLKGATENLKGRSLDDILNGTKAKESIDQVVIAGKTLNSQLDLLVQKGRAFFDIFTRGGSTKVDLNLGQVQRDLDLVVVKGRQLFDLVATRGKQKIDFDLSKIEAEAARANAALQRLGNQARGSGAEIARLTRQNQGLVASLESAGREFLLVRRLLFGLGIVTAVREVLSLVQAFDRAKQALSAVFGESQAKEEFEFIRVQAERLGISVTDLATEYGKFVIASRSLGLTQAEIRDVFLATTEAGAKLALSSEQVTGALVALQQIASKGRLSMEELRQQLGDRLPGAISIAAKALGVTEARLFAMVEAGQVASDVFLRQFPAALRASFNTDASTRITTTAASIQRFKNALQEAVDAAVRAGALQAFVEIITTLTEVLRSPVTADNLKAISHWIAVIVQGARENAAAIAVLVGAFSTFKLLGYLGSIFSSIAGGLAKIGIAGRLAPAAMASTAVAAKDLGEAAAGSASKIGGLAASVGSLALALRNPIVLVIAGLAAADLALMEALIAKLDRAREKNLELAEAQRQVVSQGRITQIIIEQAKAFEQYAETVALAANEVNSLSEPGLRFYREAAEGAKKLADLQASAYTARISQLENELKTIALTNDRSSEAIRKIVLYREEIADLRKGQDEAGARSLAFAATLESVSDRAAKQGIAFDENVQRLQALGRSFETTAKSGEVLAKVNLKDLSKDAQGLVSGFNKLIEEGKSVADALEKSIPKNFADGGIKAITDVGNGLAFLIQEGKVAANVIGDDLAKAMDKLKGNDLVKFGIQAQAAFEAGKLSAQGLSVVLDGQLKAAFKNMGLDADVAGQKISKSFNELLANFAVIAENAKTTGAQLKGALDVAINAAKTKEELLALRAEIEQLGLAGGRFGEQIRDSLLRLDDAVRLSAGKLDSALGDSFKRLGVQARAELKSIADQAVVDFERLKASGQATALELEAAFRKMAEEVIKANNGIPPIRIVAQAVDFSAFDIIVKAAETASTRIRKAIETAIPLAETATQAKALGEAIVLAFEKGKLSAQDFGKLITEVGFQIRELAAKPVGELAASAELLGLKTREQLKAMADNAREAFSSVANSGQFTNDQLAIGAKKFLDAYLAANSGVVDSFDPVVAKAMEVIQSVEGVTEAIGAMKNKAAEPIDTGNLKDRTIQELQKQLADTVKMYREIGVANVEQLQIVQAIQAELNRKGAEAGQKMRDAADAASKAAESTQQSQAKAPAPPAPGGAVGAGGGGLQGANFHFNFTGTQLSVDEIKRQIVPVLNDIVKRSR